MIRRLLLASSFFVIAGCGPHGVDSIQWMSMGTIAKVSFKGSGLFFALPSTGASRGDNRRLVETVRSVYEDVERRLSIWNGDSEISRYTAVDRVSPEMRPCYEAAFRLQEASGGVFNPFWRGKGSGPDLGGIAKGFAVDLAAENLLRDGACPVADSCDVLLDLGGNLKVLSGEWRTGIRNPAGKMLSIVLTNGMACATSGEYERGKHIYDGRTGLAVTNDLVSVTVVHPSSAMIADGLSTTLFVLGKESGERFLETNYPEATAYWIFKRCSHCASD